MTTHILPPVIPPAFPHIGDEGLIACLPYFLTALCMVLSGWALAAAFRHRYGGKLQPLLIVLPALISVLLPLRFGFGPELLRGGVLCLALLYASGADLRTREVPDCVAISIAVAALIGREPAELPLMLLAAIIITLPQLAAAVLKPGCYGGADIKIMAACAFLLGLSRGLAAIILGLLLAVVYTAIIRKINKQPIKEGFALVPYLAVGSMLAFFL